MAKKMLRFTVYLGLCMIIISCVYRFCFNQEKESVKFDASSVLTGVNDIAEFSTAEFKYRGVADVYSEDKNKLLCKACYYATVKASIDLNKIREEFDTENRIVKVIIPNFNLKVAIAEDQPMVLFPSDADVDIYLLNKYCQEDVENEAMKKEQLFERARQKFEATVEGLLYPVLKAQGYTLIIQWEVPAQS